MHDKRLVRTILGLLILQFVLGILANLYSTIPQQQPYEVFHQFGFIILHALNGVLLVILSIIFAIKSRKQADFKQSIGGMANLLLAFAFGELFVFTQNDIFSFLMALAFIGALLSYARIVFRSQ